MSFKRVWIIMVSLVLVLTLFPASIVEATELTSGTVGNCTWEYDSTSKTLTLEAMEGTNGATSSFTSFSQNESFPTIAGEVTTVVIEDGVTELGSHLFLNFTALTDVQFPSSGLTTIGEGVFRNCDALRHASIPSSVASIGRTVFWDCALLQEVTFSGSYTALPGIIVGQCTSLTTVSIPSNVSSLDVSVSAGGVSRGVFYKDTALSQINFGGTVALWETLLANIDSDSSDNEILKNSNIRVNCSDGVYVHGAVTGDIGNCTWIYLDGSKKLTIMPKTGTDGKTSSFTSFSQNQSFPDLASKVTTVVVEEGVTELGSHLFLNFAALTNVQFPSSSLTTLGEGVFRNCDALIEIELPSSLTTISRTLFWDCAKLENIVLRGNYTTLPGIMLGQCTVLETVTIPASVSSLDVSVSTGGVSRGVFYQDTAMKTINYGGTIAQWETLLAGINTESSDNGTLKNSSIRVVCSDGAYIYGRTGDEVSSNLGEAVDIPVGTSYVYYDAIIEEGKTYTLTVEWNTAPTMTGSKSKWEVESWTGLTSNDEMCETLWQVTKRDSATAASTARGVIRKFIASTNAEALIFNVQNLSAANSVTVNLVESTMASGTVSDVTIQYDANTDLASSMFDVGLATGQRYHVQAEWTTAPSHTGSGAAWWIQPVANEDVWGTSGWYYSAPMSTSAGTAVLQSYEGMFVGTDSYEMFNIYAQKISGANSFHVVISEDAATFTVPVDYVTAEKLFDVPWRPESSDANSGNIFQGIEIYNDYVFAVYDGGFCRVYNLNTGAFLQEFRFECALNSNHASGAYFGNYKYSPNDPFPLMYISCDLSTLSCYVERIIVDENGTFSSEMVQIIDFSDLKGWDGNPTSWGITTHSGSFVLLEKGTDSIVYLGRQQTAIGAENNRFVLACFDLPSCVAGNVAGTVYPGGYTIVGESSSDTITVDCPVVHFTNDDIKTVSNAEQDADGYYYWDYYGKYIQGTYIYRGNILLSHGISRNYPNYWNDRTFYTGIMNCAYDSDEISRFLDVSGSLNWYGEPQGLAIYNGRMIHYIKGAVYELSVNIEGLEDSYNVTSVSDLDVVEQAIAAAVTASIDSDYEVEEVLLPDNLEITGTEHNFTAQVSIYTTWNVQKHEIDVNLTVATADNE